MRKIASQRSKARTIPIDYANKMRLDVIAGMRAFALVAILLFQLGLGMASAHAGISVLMVIAGYLITSLAVVENSEAGGIGYLELLARRLFRLWPGIFVVCTSTLIVAFIFQASVLSSVLGSYLPSITFTNNLYCAYKNIPLPSQGQILNPLSHLWLMAQDAQFLILWPPIVLALLGRGTGDGATRIVRKGIAVVIALSTIAMGVVCYMTQSSSWSYYGFIAHLAPYACGSWLAVIWPLGQEFHRPVSPRDKQTFLWQIFNSGLTDIVAFAAFIGLIVISVVIPEQSYFFMYGGITLCAILATLVLAAALRARSPLAHMLSFYPISAVGKRAFALYIWHLPVFAAFGIGDGASWWKYLLALLVLVGLAEVSYFVFEFGFTSRFEAGKDTIRASQQREVSLRKTRQVRRRLLNAPRSAQQDYRLHRSFTGGRTTLESSSQMRRRLRD